MPKTRIGLLIRRGPGSAPPVASLPLGRAAQHLAAQGIDVLFAHRTCEGRVWGQIVAGSTWQEVHGVEVSAVFDRYSSQTDPHGHAALLQGLAGVPVANPVALIDLMRDKIRSQQVLTDGGLSMPEIEVRPSQFESTLSRWGAAYLKPRYGAFGRGVTRVVPGDPLPAIGPGAVPGVPEPLFLQRAIAPPKPFAGVACRVLVQRMGPERWWVGPPVVRRSKSDAVVNAARGAEVVAAIRELPESVQRLTDLARRTAHVLAKQSGGENLVEIGVDAVIDADGAPHLIEVNSRPRGRLEALAQGCPEDFERAHLDAICRPLQVLAEMYG